MVSFFLFASCHKREIGKTPPASSSAQPLIIDPAADIVHTGDPFSIDSLSLNQDVLSIFVQYSGGCQEHAFGLYFNGSYSRALPPEARLNLKHDAKEDHCRELVSKELKFNISDLRHKSSETVILQLQTLRLPYISK